MGGGAESTLWTKPQNYLDLLLAPTMFQQVWTVVLEKVPKLALEQVPKLALEQVWELALEQVWELVLEQVWQLALEQVWELERSRRLGPALLLQHYLRRQQPQATRHLHHLHRLLHHLNHLRLASLLEKHPSSIFQAGSFHPCIFPCQPWHSRPSSTSEFYHARDCGDRKIHSAHVTVNDRSFLFLAYLDRLSSRTSDPQGESNTHLGNSHSLSDLGNPASFLRRQKYHRYWKCTAEEQQLPQVRRLRRPQCFHQSACKAFVNS